MEKEFVPYELALRMKQLGFDEPCFGFYDDIDDHHPLSFIRIEGLSEKLKSSITLAPTWQQTFRWFRDEYKLFHEVFIDCEPRADVPLEEDLMFSFTIHCVREDKFIVGSRNIYKTQEEAELACLEKLIEIVEQKQKEK
jgi:hypothetical protein